MQNTLINVSYGCGIWTSSMADYFQFDQRKRNYLHPVAGSEAESTGAGLFKRISDKQIAINAADRLEAKAGTVGVRRRLTSLSL